MDGDHFGGIGDESVGKLREMDKPVFLDAYVHESTEIGDIADDTGKHHAFAEVIDGANISVEFKTCIVSRGSRPGLSSSWRISFRVGSPTVG